ncbi:carboxypeptidase-like regulatory domain-containing protein [Terriglobus saanensis]|uniref:TonB-dependent receptor n=1 Tax=Terriglobus saanensis (strain ATCC BAA-1853 / DSM 23119 / SP1PR4) TaxID=401053 RepID=E8V2H1_TERSS|nr:carboxypeptidase-like regulatory domain-containing protein [Terriglobus saanensis]ADV82389.1 TonB-dependent receptor [Terriglobus saanensis SP1PR4]
MKRLLFVVLILFVSSVGLALGQAVDSQQITGVVTDPAGAAVPHAEVTVTNEATRVAHSVRSNDDGNYTVLNLPVGVYTVTTVMQGFKKSILSGVNVDVGGKPAVPVQLEIGQVTESVAVKAGVVLIQTTTAEIGGVVTSTEATQIQLNGRNYIQLLTLQPGVSQTVASGFAIFGTYGVNGNSQSVNGIRTDSANFFIDGVDNKDNGGGGNNFVNISPDSLQQFRNVASSYDASYGGTSGATVSVAIKSGGHDFHGSAYEYIRNDAIQGYPFRAISSLSQAPIKAPLRYNDFGYTIGGPIWIPGVLNRNRDKLFFFAAQEYKRLRTSTVTNASVPTPAAIASAIATGPSTATGRALAATVLTDPSGNYRYLSLGNNNQSEYLVKVDYNLNEKNQISGHYVHDNVLVVGNPTNYIIYDRTIPGLTASLSWTHTFNSKTVNTATGSFSGNIINEGGNIRTNPQFANKPINRSDYGLTYATLYNASNRIPQITITGFGNPGVTPRQFDNYQRIFALKDDFSRVLGNHSVKAGGYFWRARKNQTAPPQLNGAFTFSDLAGLVAGNFASYTEGSNIPQVQARFLQFETYVQDDWTVGRRLTVNLGLRWQYMPPISSWPNNAAFFDPNFYDATKAATIDPATGLITTAPAPYNGLVLPGTGFSDKAKQVVAASVYNNPQVQALFHNLPGGVVNTVYNTFAPRVGFAYDLSGRQETVIHGGYGMSYERVEGNYYYGAVSQLPFTAVASLASAGNADNLGSIGINTSAPTNISNSADRNLEPPRIHNYSVGVQRKLFSNTSAEVNYVGSRSTNLTYRKNLNQGAAGIEAANPGVARNALRPYKGYGEIYQYSNGEHSNFNSLQARLQTRFSKGGLVTLAYTWSKSLTDGSTFDYQPQDSTNIHGDYGPANYSQPKIFVASYVYPLPFWQHEHAWYKQVLGGWQLSGITRIANGLPINVIQPSGLSVAGNLVTTANVAQRPNLVGNPYAHNGQQYLNYVAFRAPAAGTYGNLHYDDIKGPLFNNWDAALQKNISIHEEIGVEFRAEMFNVPNHMSFFAIGGTLGAPQADGSYQPNFSSTGSFQNSFGQVTSATDPRTMEFVLRVHF